LNGGAGGGECSAAFGPAAAERIFQRIARQAGSDGCTLDDVRTDRSRMDIVWKKADTGDLPAIVLEPAECAALSAVPGGVPGEPLAMTTPPEVAVACPDALAAVVSAVHAVDPRPARLEATFPRSAAELSWIVVGLALLGASVIAVRSLRRGAS
jgi:hypothetical protein